MKRIILKLTGIAVLSSLALTACQHDKLKDESVLAALLASSIRSSASGNCAISLNLATLYSGAIIQSAVNTSTIFTESDFNAATGTTATALGYTNYAAVPYNVKYDAFIRGGGTYDATARTADINSAKALTDLVALAGQAAVLCSANAATPAATLQGATTQFLATYSTAEQTALNAAVAGVTSTVINGALAAGCGAVAGAPWTSFGGATATASAYQARHSFVNGAAILACARIPRTQCTFAALTTADRATAIRNGVTAVDNVANNSDCRKTNADFVNNMIRTNFTGVPRGTVISGFTSSPSVTASPTDGYIAISEGSTAPNNRIFAESAYPIASALSAISTNFNVAFPMTVGNVKQGESTIPYYRASNINLVQVETCESLGFAGYGTTTSGVTGNATLATKLELTPARELAYAFSPENTAATLYAAVRGATQGNATAAELDAIACNNSFRSRFSVPLAIGGGKLGALNSAVSGNGAATATLTTCTYGGTTTSRTTTNSLLSTTLAGIES